MYAYYVSPVYFKVVFKIVYVLFIARMFVSSYVGFYIFVLKPITDTPGMSLVLVVFPCRWEWIFVMLM